MTTNRIVWEKDGTCWEICGNTSKRLRYTDENIGYSSPTKVKMRNIIPQIKKLSINLTSTKISRYSDAKLDDNIWKYDGDEDKQNSHMIQIGAHLHSRQTGQFQFIGIVIKKTFGGTELNKNGKMIDYYILETDPKEKSLGLGLSPNTIVPKIEEDHPRFIHFNKNGEERKAKTGRGSMRYKYDTCSNSGITRINTSPIRGILF